MGVMTVGGGVEDGGISQVGASRAVIINDPLDCVITNNVSIISAVFASILDQPGALLHAVLTPSPRLAEELLSEHHRWLEQR